MSSFGPDGTAASEFDRAGPIAIDQTSEFVYVADALAGALYKFDIEGNPVSFSGSAGYISGNALTGLSFRGSVSTSIGEDQVTVDPVSHRIYVTSGNAVKAFEPSGEPAEFTAGPGAGTNEIATFNELRGVAVDSNGTIYAADFNLFNADEAVRIFTPSGESITSASIGTNLAANLAVDTNGNLYVNFAGGRVHKLVPSEFPVVASTEYSLPQPFAENPSTTVAVDPATNDVYVVEDGSNPQVVRYDESGELLTTFAGDGEEGDISRSDGLAIHGATTRVFISDAPLSGLSQVAIFQPLVGAPSVEDLFVTDVTADSARLSAEINPNTRATAYHFEYGLTECSVGPCASVPPADVPIGSGHNALQVSQRVSGLVPGQTYHYRVVAVNDLGITDTPEGIFHTQGSDLEIELADSRVWEMVSPQNKHSGILVNAAKGPMQAAADGNGIAYQSLGSIEPEAEGNRAIERSMVLSNRDGDAWQSRDITPPHVKPTILGTGNEYSAFDSNLAMGLLEPKDDNPLSIEASDMTPYLRTNSEPPRYKPLVTAQEGFANVLPGTEFGGPGREIRASGATPDLQHVILRSEAPLAAGAEPSSLYRWSNGQLKPVSVLPDDEEGGKTIKGLFGSGIGSTQNAVSQDGSRVFWGRGEYDPSGIKTTGIFLRDLSIEESVRLDIPEPDALGLGDARPAFQGASADGQVVFFSDSRQLTADASPEGRDLYRCEMTSTEPLACSLTNVTAPRVGSGESANFLGVVSALNEEGSKVYFVAQGVLSTDANEAGEEATTGQPNLYLWDEESGIRYIATLSPKRDTLNWGNSGGGVTSVSFFLSTSISPSGQYFAFVSSRSLTGYNNRDESSGELDQEVFLYNALGDTLSCPSCNPTGASPEGTRIHVDAGFALVDPQRIWQDEWVAAVLPEVRRSGFEDHSFYRPRGVFNNGRVFFNAADSLVPADSNGAWDVYQYEPTGVGSCSSATGSASVVRHEGGCLGLISSGTGGEESGFLDASATGNDVFFLAPDRLSVLDKDNVYDVYDARVNGVAAVLSPVTECLGEACQPSVALPNDPTPASESFRGPGNQIQCRKGQRKVRRSGKARCVRRKHQKQKHRNQKQKQRKRAGQAEGANR